MKKKIATQKLPSLWAKLAEEGSLYLPIQEGPVVLFAPWHEGAQVALEAVNSVVSPKDIFLPREETYFKYQCAGQDLKITETAYDEPVIAFGIHACDLKAIEMLDKVFMEEGSQDTLYSKRREMTTVVALSCTFPDPYCFCEVFGINPQDAPGADVMAHLDQDYLHLEARTEKGEALLKKAAALLEESTFEASTVKLKQTDFGLEVQGLSERLKDQFDHPAWEKLYKSCLGCGVCTYVCPTCYCFDVEDYGHEAGGERFRCWDSCMFKEFTQMAGGHNPRPGRKERVRQRFMHKLSYYPEKYGEIACVGCGRCLRSCPVNLDIVHVIKALGGEKVEQR